MKWGGYRRRSGRRRRRARRWRRCRRTRRWQSSEAAGSRRGRRRRLAANARGWSSGGCGGRAAARRRAALRLRDKSRTAILQAPRFRRMATRAANAKTAAASLRCYDGGIGCGALRGAPITRGRAGGPVTCRTTSTVDKDSSCRLRHLGEVTAAVDPAISGNFRGQAQTAKLSAAAAAAISTAVPGERPRRKDFEHGKGNYRLDGGVPATKVLAVRQLRCLTPAAAATN